MIKLYDTKTGREIKVGDTVKTFRGETCVVSGWPVNGRNRVWVRFNPDENSREFFPTVIGAELRKE